MKVIHGTWIPNACADFIQNGVFYLWVETPSVKKRRSVHQRTHPLSLTKADLEAFLISELGITPAPAYKISDNISPQYFALPTANDQPLPSPELTRYLEAEISDEDYEGFEYWKIDCYEVNTMVKTGTYSHSKVPNVIKLLNDIHFLALNNSFEIQFGSDLLFWYHYTQSFKQIILKDQYIPALKYRELPAIKGKRKQQANEFEIYPAWEIVFDKYDSLIQRYIDYMPLVCVAGCTNPSATVEFFSRETLLRHFSECLLHEIVTHTPSTAKFDQLLSGSFLHSCFHPDGMSPQKTHQALEEYKQWYTWKEKITRTQTATPFDLCFQLQEAPANEVDNWQIHFLVADKQDPSLKLSLADYWLMNQKAKKGLVKHFRRVSAAIVHPHRLGSRARKDIFATTDESVTRLLSLA